MYDDQFVNKYLGLCDLDRSRTPNAKRQTDKTSTQQAITTAHGIWYRQIIINILPQAERQSETMSESEKYDVLEKIGGYFILQKSMRQLIFTRPWLLWNY